MGRTRLFCLPYAGSSAFLYKGWEKKLHSSIELHPLEMPGRGLRNKEDFYSSMEEAVEDLYQRIKGELLAGRYAFYGHSMGTLLVYELIHKIYANNGPEPVYSFFSGRYPPQVGYKGKILHRLPDNEFMQEISKLGGTPEEFFDHPELLQLFIPVLKADYRLVEKYVHQEKKQRLQHDIIVLNGKEDRYISFEDLLEWTKITDKKCFSYTLEGGHFFIKSKQQDVINIINHYLASE